MPIFRPSDIQLFAGALARRLEPLGLPPHAETYTFGAREERRVSYLLLLHPRDWAARVADQEAMGSLIHFLM